MILSELCLGVKYCRKRTETMSCLVIGQGIVNVISSLIGCLSTASKMIFWCWPWLAPGHTVHTVIYLINKRTCAAVWENLYGGFLYPKSTSTHTASRNKIGVFTKELKYPEPTNRKTPCAGGIRVRRASAGRWENLSIPGPSGPGQTQGIKPGVWGALRWELINNSRRIAPVPDPGGSGTLRFSTSTAAARRTRMPPAQGVFRPPLATTNFH